MKTAILIAFVLLAAAAPAKAQPDCVAAIRAAVQGKDVTVPEQCWHLGPLTLGIAPSAVEAALGPPDATEPATAMWKGKYLPAQGAIYVYPRDLAVQLKQHPMRPIDFHPLSLRLIYNQNHLVAIRVTAAGRIDFGRCTAPEDKSGSAGAPATFPYSFYGIALGAPRDKMIKTFGAFHGRNDTHDFWIYWPVPLSIDGEDKVDSLSFADSMVFASVGGMVHYVADQDPTNCRIHGFRIITER